MTTVNIVCDGPGPHIPADGILGTADRKVTGMRCSSAACVPQPDPAVAIGVALDDRLDQGLAGLRSYINTASPTTAQTTTAVKLLCRVAIALIRRQRNLLDGTD